MNDLSLVERLLDEVQEEYDFDHVLPLYVFAWSLAGMGVNRSDPEFKVVCRRAYDTFVERHPDLRLMWVPWPIDTSKARAVEPGTPIDLDADPEASVDTPLLALVTPDDYPS